VSALPHDAEAILFAHIATVGFMTNASVRTLFGVKSATRYDTVPEVDKLLQRLRRAGKIVAKSGKWYAATQLPCPSCGGSGVARKKSP